MDERQMQQFIESYQYEEDCEAFLCKLRWPNGFVCPRCDHDQCYIVHTRMLYECRECRVQVSATAGTVMHNSKLPLQVWFRAFQLLIQGNQEVSALSLAKELGVNYRTARLMLSKIKLALHQQNVRVEAFKNMTTRKKERPAAQEPSCQPAAQDEGEIHLSRADTTTSVGLVRTVRREGCYRAIWRTRLFEFSWNRDKMPNPVKLFRIWMNAFTSIFPRYAFYL